MVGYVVLHYQNIDITKRCVTSLRNISQESIIAIVDNCSPNHSGIELLNIYKNDENIIVFLNTENLGFAKGNNIGFKYLKDNYELDTIVVMNNDIIIEDPEFENIIQNFMTENNVDVCGPDMVTPKNNHQNPLSLTPFSDTFLRKRVRIDRIKCFLFHSKLFYVLYRKYKKNNTILPREKQPKTFDCILHGSCVIFGKRYIDKENFAFLPITYMYNEEHILYDYLKHKGYKTGYCDDVSILHMEGVSTSTRTKDDRAKVIFRFINNTKSLELQLLEREKYKRG